MWNQEIELQHNRPLRISGNAIVECRGGTVWITSSAMAGDHFLRPGEKYRLAGGIILVEALASARIVLQPTGLRKHVLALGNFFRQWADRRAHQYSGIYLRCR
jgi:hypothetical protein